ncbi:MAG TPA: branched-chain amino acid ABC transporter permease [Candidatus Paceibacterota bacterium]
MDIVPQLIANSLIAAGLYAMLAIGFNLIYSTTKFFDLGYGVMTAVGGYGAYFSLKTLDLPWPIAAIIGTLLAGLVGYVVYRVVYAPLRARQATNMALMVAALGVLTMLQAFISILFSNQFQPLGAPVGGVLNIWGAAISHTQIWILAASSFVMFALSYVLSSTSFGKAVRAIGDNEEVSKIVGIHTKKIIGYVFFVGSAIGGLAGILYGLDTGIEPTMGLALLLKGVVASIIGGIGNVYAGVLGAVVLGFAENFGIWKISGEWKDAIAFGLLILFLIFRPNGLIRKS